MASTIERVRDSLDPQTTANAVYEIILLWHEKDTYLHGLRKGQAPKHQAKRAAYEECLGLFLGIPQHLVRAYLRSHYGTRSDG